MQQLFYYVKKFYKNSFVRMCFIVALFFSTSIICDE